MKHKYLVEIKEEIIQYLEFVVEAETEEEAREIALKNHFEEEIAPYHKEITSQDLSVSHINILPTDDNL